MVDGIQARVEQGFQNAQKKLGEYRDEPGLIGLEAQVAFEEAIKPAQTNTGKIVAGVDTFVHALATATALPVIHFVGDAAAAIYGGAKYGAGALLSAVGGDAAVSTDLKNSGKRSLMAAGVSAGSALANVVPVAGQVIDAAGSAAAHGYATKVSFDATGITRKDVDAAVEAAKPQVAKARSAVEQGAEAAAPVVKGVRDRAAAVVNAATSKKS